MAEENHFAFKKFIEATKSTAFLFEFYPEILCSGFWPPLRQSELILPKEMDNALALFKQFYYSKMSGRKLTWIHSLGTNTILGRFQAGDKEIICSTEQASLLMLFNEFPRVLLDDARKATNLPQKEIDSIFMTLVDKRYPILVLDKRADSGISYTVNEKFSSKSRRIKLPLAAFKITEKERSEVEKTTAEDRKFLIDAVIVRIMKSRKQLSHTELVQASIEQLALRLRPDPRLIKKRIEDLIHREYLERDPEIQTNYRYLA